MLRSARMWQWFGVAALVAVAGCGGSPGQIKIALDSDFAPYTTWSSYYLGDQPVAGHPVGPRTGFLNQKAPPGATAYPVGTIIVKEIQTLSSTDKTTWDLFAMVKRGGNFDQGGALDWEFFILKLTADGVPTILDRGANPSDSVPDGGVDHGYGDSTAGGVTCNACHGGLGTDQTDHILSPLLQPGAAQ